MQRSPQSYESFLDDEELVKQLIEATDVDEVVERMEIERYHHIAPLLREMGPYNCDSKKQPGSTLSNSQQQQWNRDEPFHNNPDARTDEMKRTRDRGLRYTMNTASTPPPPPPETLSPIEDPLERPREEMKPTRRRYTSPAPTKSPLLSSERKRQPPTYDDQDEKPITHRIRRRQAYSAERLRPPKSNTSRGRPLSPANPRGYAGQQRARSYDRKPPPPSSRRISPQDECPNGLGKSPSSYSCFRSAATAKPAWRGVKNAQRYMDLFAPPAANPSENRSPLRRIKGGYIAPLPPPDGQSRRTLSARKRPLSPPVPGRRLTPPVDRYFPLSSGISRWGRMDNGYDSELTDASEDVHPSDDALQGYTGYDNYVVIPPRVVERERCVRNRVPTMSPARSSILVSPCRCFSSPCEKSGSSDAQRMWRSPQRTQRGTRSPQVRLSPAVDDSRESEKNKSTRVKNEDLSRKNTCDAGISFPSPRQRFKPPDMVTKKGNHRETQTSPRQPSHKEVKNAALSPRTLPDEKTPRPDGTTEQPSTKSPSLPASTRGSNISVSSSEGGGKDEVPIVDISKENKSCDNSHSPDSVTHTYKNVGNKILDRKTAVSPRVHDKDKRERRSKRQKRIKRRKNNAPDSSTDQSGTSDSSSSSIFSSGTPFDESRTTERKRRHRRTHQKSGGDSHRQQKGKSALSSDNSSLRDDTAHAQVPKVYPPLTSSPQRIRKPICLQQDPVVRPQVQSASRPPFAQTVQRPVCTPEPFISFSSPPKSKTDVNGIQRSDNAGQGVPSVSIRVVPPPSPGPRREPPSPTAPKMGGVKIPYMSYLHTSSPTSVRASQLGPAQPQQTQSAASAATPRNGTGEPVWRSSGHDSVGRSNTRGPHLRRKWAICGHTQIRSPPRGGRCSSQPPHLQAHEWTANGQRMTTTRQITEPPLPITPRRSGATTPQRPNGSCIKIISSPSRVAQH
ncbi:hypothetical protein, conserved [Trypanosoma brucei gambiense DAL972]|uniref:Uncharacterized protein n=1 Tax=Trypanosoma brucei gambiense (strain MHOM/CI/86/DAL972) TaxID=679716 RepID=D0A766_TRYB9|nr:hypothetical protein, conserved [Trypanosoma brucei gambiense DAL972]CBH17517.1 hypothetical protein, conserved [Trypanosoma brucei gambiense DAL972]|eukprot:XP_011779781.1 hypothetical protein, conserved [Trypanosoma brucei gambiense DAL972]